ncbi:MAG TPA: cell surface protein SprA [Gemmatimonadaceae bacterium]|nr:cell surface protein SprA [Gemmatimonadaceae bacterium]
MRVLRLVTALAASTVSFAVGARAQDPVPTAPVPRVDSVRVDTLKPAAPDSTRRVVFPKPPAADTARPAGIFGPRADLGLDVRARIEAKGERTRNERCDGSQQYSVFAACRTAFQPDFNFQLSLRSNGTVADRVHVNVDYDTQREFDASNAVNVYYEGKTTDRLQRLEVGNVAFTLPSTRFLSSGVPSGNYGLQAVGRLGPFRVQAIAAQQKGNIVKDRTFLVGERTRQDGERQIEDYQVEPKRFFFTVDPALFVGAYPNVDILDRSQLAGLAASLPDTLRPRRVLLYRVQFGTQPQNPNGPRLRLNGDVGGGRQTYDVLREGVDYYLDPSQLWFALVRPLDQQSERLLVAYTVRVNGRDTVWTTTGGTPDVQNDAARDQIANLVSDPNVLPGTAAFRREIRSVYRIGGDELVRATTRLRVVSGTGDQEKPAAGAFDTFLQMFGLAQPVNPADFDIENRLWPRPTDPNYSAAAGGSAGLASTSALGIASSAAAASGGKIIRDYFVVFPSLQPFARRDSGLVVPGNPSNEAVYTTPSEYLYSPQHPASVYRLKVRYQTEGGGDAGALMLGSVQVRRGSERVVVDGVPLVRDVDYRVDYELGRLSFARPETLFTRQRAVTVRFEENPLFAVTPTTLLGVTSTLPLRHGELNFMAVQQTQKTNYTRPQLGFEPVSSLLAGVNGRVGWDVAPLTRLVNRLPFVKTTAPSRLTLQGEIATSRPQVNSDGEAFVESFEGEAGITVGLTDPVWALSSQPADGRLLPQRYGANPFDLRRASTIAFQSNGTTAAGAPILVRSEDIDQNAEFAGLGFSSTEQLLWLTLYPLAVGGNYDPRTKSFDWRVANALAGRRFRSIRTVLSPSGVDLSRVENLEFWTLVDTSAARRSQNPTLVFDVGEISENTVAFAPETLTVVRGAAGADSVFGGKKLQGLDRLDTERDPLSRAFNGDVNDVGLPGDRADTLVVVDGLTAQRLFDVPVCSGIDRSIPRLGDTRTNCTVRNSRLDEEDIDLDGVLNLPSGARNQERLARFVVDLADPRRWTRFGKPFTQQLDSTTAGRTLQWVLVRVPFRVPDDTINDVLLRRVRALRLTVVSGVGTADADFVRLPIARLKLTGAPWLKRSEQTLIGIGGEQPAGGYTLTSLIGTADRDSLRGQDYQPPPGVFDELDTKSGQYAVGSVQINERSLRLQSGNLPVYGRAEAFYRFPNGQQSFMGYQELRLWARGRRNGWGERGELQMFVKIGRDANNFYLYRTPVNAGNGAEAWLPEVRVDFNRFFALRQKLQNAYLQNRSDSLSCGGVDSALVAASPVPALAGRQRYVACDGGYMVYTVEPGAAPPNLAAVQEMSVGFVRLPAQSSQPTSIGPADSLELWVDDIRLGKVVNHPGYAGQVSLALSAADVADIRVGFTRKDPHFRQLTDAPSFVDDRLIDVVSTIHLEKLLPVRLGIAVPLTITHLSSASSPLYLSGTDIRGDGVQNLRAPRTGSTVYSLSVRRTAALRNPLLGALVDNLGLTSTYTTGDSRNEYQQGRANNFALNLDYNVNAAPRTARLPGVLGSPLGLLPAALRGARRDTLVGPGTVFRWNPTVLRVTSGIVRGIDRRFSFFKPAFAADDSARESQAESNLWRNATTLELRPTTAITARWDFVSLRDLRDYGDTTAAARAATESRASVFGANVGAERERSLLSSFAIAPQTSSWFKPRADFGTQYGMLRDPNLRSYALTPFGSATSFGNMVIDSAMLPRRITVSQNLGAGFTLDLGKAITLHTRDSSVARRWAKIFAPFDLTLNRSLLSAFDGAAGGSPIPLQFGFGGVESFRSVNGELATATGLTQALAATQSFLLPGGASLVSRYRRTTTRSWTRRADETQGVADGAQTVFPDVSLRWTWQPPKSLRGLLTSLGANAGYANSSATSFIPGDAGFPFAESRASHVRTFPLNASVAWGFGRGLTTSAGYTRTTRTDSLPGSIAEGRADDMSVDVGRAFRLPRNLGFTFDGDIRTRVGYQQTRNSTFVSDFARTGTSRLADNGRSAVSVNADADLSETLVFTLQGSRLVTYDNNFNRRQTQLVLSTVLQVQFFGDAK